MGDVVTSFNNQPEELETFEIPSKEYAVFTIKPKSKFAWGISIGRMKRYIYIDWINNSDYELDSDKIGDFVLHDERSEMKNPEIDLYVSIKKKYTRHGFKGQTYHVHIRYSGDWDEIRFRDYLIKNEDIAKEYETMKLKLAEKYPNDREAYTSSKTEWIKKINDLTRKQSTTAH